MSSAGHVFEMIARIKNNEALKKALKNRYKDLREAYLKHSEKHTKLIDKNKLTEKELLILRNNIKSKIIKDRRITATKTIILFILVISVLSVLLYYLITNIITQFI